MCGDSTLEEFQRQFGAHGVFGVELQPVITAETEFYPWVHYACQRRNQITDALLGYCVSTFHLASGSFMQEPQVDQQAMFMALLAWYVGQFKRFRAAEVAFYAGYGMSAASLLRDIRDWCFAISAMQHGVISWEEYHGGPMGAFTATDPNVERGRHATRMLASTRAKNWAIGKASGLKRWNDLTKWDRMMNYETHGAMVTTVIESGTWLDGKGPLPIGPRQDERNQRLYVSRSLEFGHLFLRLLPVLQVNVPFDARWVARWQCLDNMYMSNWTSSVGGASYMPAFAELVAAKFDFNPERTRLDIRVEPGAAPPVLDY